ncbi:MULTISPECIES: hypothetical protein [Marinobacterium]|jgi:hypothetical protein|uniref:Uncharacterized protein n=1 Tax=Marinobacterium iners DSM 11526 TaxID=1122198 RepID=A0A1H3YRB1_9GAMM|nr:hypothetical protein [Marinobacterium iners]QSR33771.1 hypothetical protein CFI10_02015 [Marinobacterium iners]SEA14076.1 hypothetical protein SAMN02745729_101568 [Marinobacterium iners DSM 11526]
MHELTLEELTALLNVFNRAGASQDAVEADLLSRIKTQHAEKEELASMDFDDCLGGACKL